jgi:methionine biosynthesis protein MetW
MNAKYVRRLSRTDREVIFDLVPREVRVLDLGCGDGRLLSELIQRNQVKGMGVDIDGALLAEGLARGLDVYQGDLDEGLADFPDLSYDYVILNQTLQTVKNPLLVLREMLRIGCFGIVGFPNFANWRLRWGLFFGGRAPKSQALPFEWYDTPNIRVLSVRYFADYCHRENIRIVKSRCLIGRRWVPATFLGTAVNLFAQIGIFVISRNFN